MASDTDEENYVTIGTPFNIVEEKEPLRKPTKLEEQIATDQKGRRRFHGAFTGGFSAGYFNTVGSKEGWTPSSFKSSRTNRYEKGETSVARPEDFMDDEDFADHGIAPRNLKPVNTFESNGRFSINIVSCLIQCMIFKLKAIVIGAAYLCSSSMDK